MTRTRLALAAAAWLGCLQIATAQAPLELVELRPADLAASDNFGVSVDLDADTLVAGASVGRAAYVYERRAGTWTLQAKLVPPGPSAGNRFGHDVAVDGDTIVVGDPEWEIKGSPFGYGTVYVFERSGTSWNFQQQLYASNAALDSHFGRSLDLVDDVLLVGSPERGVGGIVYVFERSGTSFVETTFLQPSGLPTDVRFGFSLAFDGERAVIGAMNAPGGGGAYVLRREGQAWVEEALLQTTLAKDLTSWSGASVAVDGKRVIVGAPYTDLARGAASVFVRNGTTWTEEDWLFTGVSAGFDLFGDAVAIAGSLAFVGDLNGPAGENLGAVWIFQQGQGGWSQAGQMLASDNQPLKKDGSYFFGTSVAAQGETVAVGATGDRAPGTFLETGAVYVFSVGAFASFCDAGDGSLASCPCGNGGAPTTGCDLAQSTGGVELTIVDQDLDTARATLDANGFPPMGRPASVLMRSAQLAGAPAVFGDGVLCVAAPVVRMGATLAEGGSARHAIGHGAMAGEFHYQAWFRNTPGTFCDAAAAFNLSSGRSLTW